ncbi:serine endoprotease [Candidatus Pantoea edessiphila]|uniref:Serine endoprotease n=1 Tax=Candidatus Pantoea edessiphila TaxID=2044610 RepID=A0A2P5SY28_9GAMM|nr:Do family serine endopeptidase [Candidatus Pantoea edessiphila]MBK4775572.1 Do family serine endopeptidase [Pantoea sp. Edef]PPI87225.1 serine endoprotease [Candidatus Pantoea edessiphila]
MKKILLIFNALIFNFIILISNFINITTAEAAYNSERVFSLSPVLKKTMPAVVSVFVEGDEDLTPQYIKQFNDTPQKSNNSIFYHNTKISLKSLLKIYNDDEESDNNQDNDGNIFKNLGSGVIINADKGYIVTNNHVINDAKKIEVRLSDNRHYYAKLIGQDIQSDIALIQLKDVKDLTVMKLADSDKLRVGDYTIAIGNPYGLGEAATYGIISGIGRIGFNDYGYQNFIQTDATINRGNSGGALVNLKGELIGLNTAIFSPDGSNTRIGFAIPSNLVKEIINQIINYGQVRHIDLGLSASPVDLKMAKTMKIDSNIGAFVSRVVKNSTAYKYGIKVGDIITLINNSPIYSLASIYNNIGLLPIGTTVKLRILRDKKFIDLLVTLDQVDLNVLDSSIISKNIEGAKLTNGNSYDKGVYVNKIISRSIAAKIGFRKGDLILSVNNKNINNLGDLRRMLEKQHSFLVFNVQRNARNIYLFYR